MPTSVASLLIAAALARHGRFRSAAPPPPSPPTVDPKRLTVLLAPVEAGTFMIRGDPKDAADIVGSVSFARLVVLVSSEEHNGPDLDFNGSVSFSVDGGPRGPAEPMYKIREANELQEPPPVGLAPGGRRISVLSWAHESAQPRNSMCVTVQIDAVWVAAGTLGARAQPVERCFSLDVTSVLSEDLGAETASSARRRRGRAAEPEADDSGRAFLRPSPAGMQHAYFYAGRGARIELFRELLVAPSATDAASLLEPGLAVEGWCRFVTPISAMENSSRWFPLEVASEGVVRRNPLPDGPPYVRVYSARMTLWIGEATAETAFKAAAAMAVAPQAHVEFELVVARRASRGGARSEFTQQLCTRLNSFACEWSAAEVAPADNVWRGTLAPQIQTCDRPPSVADVERTASAQGALVPFAPLTRVRSLLRVEYESPGGIFTSCGRDEVRREAAPAERFFIDPFLGLQQVAPWSVRSAHLARYGCNTTEGLPADARIPVGALPAESCLGSDNYSPDVQWTARADRLYTLMAWITPPDDRSHARLQWLVVDIPGADVARGVVLQRYVGPLPTGAFENLELFAIAVYEQPQGAAFAELPIWPGLGLGDSLVSADRRIGPAPVSAKLLVEALGLGAGPYAYTWFFTNTDLWVSFALEYIYGDPKSAAGVCAFDQVNHIVNPVGGYCTNGFYAAPENSAAPFEYLRFDDNGMSAITLDTCAARGFHYPVLEPGTPHVNQSAIVSTIVVPSGKTIRRYGRVLMHCDPKDAAWSWLGAPFCDGAVFSFPRYEAKVSTCDWRALVPDAPSRSGGGAAGHRRGNPESRGELARRRRSPADGEAEVEPCMDSMARCHAAWSRPDIEPVDDQGEGCREAMRRCAAAGWQLAAGLKAWRELTADSPRSAGGGAAGHRHSIPETHGELTRRKHSPADEEAKVEPCMDSMARCHAAWSRPDIEPVDDQGEGCREAMRRCAAAGWQLAAELKAAQQGVTERGAGRHLHLAASALAGLACAVGGAAVALAAVHVRERPAHREHPEFAPPARVMMM